jgi:hypothetical protein
MIQEQLNYIQEAKLSYPALTNISSDRPHTSTADSSGKHNSSRVCAGSLVSIVAGICDQHQKDVLDSTLYAQLAANGQYSRETDTAQWYSTYCSTLTLLGWHTVGFSFQKSTHLSSTFQLNKTILGLTAKLLSKSAQSSLTATIKAISHMKSSDRSLQVLSQSAFNANMGNFQLGIVEESKDDIITMQMMAMLLTSPSIPTQFMSGNYSSSSTTLFTASQTMTLDDYVYSQMRDTVQQSLGSSIQDFILSVPIDY